MPAGPRVLGIQRSFKGTLFRVYSGMSSCTAPPNTRSGHANDPGRNDPDEPSGSPLYDRLMSGVKHIYAVHCTLHTKLTVWQDTQVPNAAAQCPPQPRGENQKPTLPIDTTENLRVDSSITPISAAFANVGMSES